MLGYPGLRNTRRHGRPMNMKQLLAVVFLLLAGGPVLATEEPQYEVVKQYEAFELRLCPAVAG